MYMSPFKICILLKSLQSPISVSVLNLIIFCEEQQHR